MGFSVVAEGPTRPNVIIFLVDDMGVMDTSVPFLTNERGVPTQHPLNHFFRTPAMEKLAKQGVRFNQFCSQSVCSPSRASIMTGQNATRHQTTTWINPRSNNRGDFGPPQWNWEGLKKGDITLPLVLKNQGYRTIHIGKAHFGGQQHEGSDPKNLGFDVNIAGDCWGRPKSYLSENHYGNHPKYKKDKKGKTVVVTHNVPHLEKYYDTGTFLTEALTLEAKEQIRQAAGAKQPFFLHLSHYALHSPFDVDERFIEHYESSDKDKKAKAFATLVEGMDQSLGDVMKELERLKIAEDTLIIFLGDNGTDAPLGKAHEVACAAPLRGKKATHYEGGMRIPFMASWAKINPEHPWQKKFPIAKDMVQSQLGTVMDIFPTVLDLIELQIPNDHQVDGSSLRKLFTGAKDPSRSEMFLMHFPHRHRSSYFTSYRLGEWKVIYHYNPKRASEPRYELYHLKDDPFESENLVSSAPERLTMMMEAMVKQLEGEGALYPIDAKGRTLKPLIP